MNASVYLLLGTVFVSGPNASAHSAESSSQAQRAAHSSALTEEVRKELLDARQAVWTAFFQKDQALLEEMLAPELIAIQEYSERWENRTRLLAMAKSMSKQGARLVRLEFPRTEIQLFGDTAILYYTYIFEMTNQGRTGLNAGRGTEVFVRRDGKWVDVGWHLDNGAFVRQGGQWVRVGEPYPEPTPVSSSQVLGRGRMAKRQDMRTSQRRERRTSSNRHQRDQRHQAADIGRPQHDDARLQLLHPILAAHGHAPFDEYPDLCPFVERAAGISTFGAGRV